MNKLTFATTTSAALRVQVSGASPREIDTLLLTGSGDEQELELSPGPYTASVTDIGTGEAHSFDFAVDDGIQDLVIRVGPTNTSKAGAWRSARAAASSSLATTSAWLKSARPAGSPEDGVRLRLKMRTERGWRSFRATALVNSDKPDTLKIARPGAWNENPTVRLDFTSKQHVAFHCFLPLFSGGTILSWDKIGNLHDMMPSDPKSAAIVGGLSTSLRSEVPGILRWVSGGTEEEALKIISQSRDDPWVAVAAGLLLIGSGRAKQTGPWTMRLASRHTWMADFGVLSAWWNAASRPSDEEGCLNMMVQAREQGHVYFWNSFAFGEQLLSTLGSGSKSSRLRSDARKEIGRWKRLRSGAIKAGAFAVWGDPVVKRDDGRNGP